MDKIKIVSDGVRKHTTIWKNGVLTPFNTLHILIDAESCICSLDDIPVKIEYIVIDGVYTITGDGSFVGTKFLIDESYFRGISSMEIFSSPDYNLIQYNITGAILPNLVALREDGTEECLVKED